MQKQGGGGGRHTEPIRGEKYNDKNRVSHVKTQPANKTLCARHGVKQVARNEAVLRRGMSYPECL
jgi:hypothetical protein